MSEITVIERAAIALGTAEHEKALVELSTKYADIVEIKNPAGREQAHSAYMTLKTARVAIEKAGKDAREDATRFSKAVIAEQSRLIAITEAEEARLQALRDAWDTERAAEKAAAAAAEQDRIDGIRAKIDDMRATPVCLVGKSSADIGVAADHLSETVISLDEYAEFTGEAQAERDHSVKQLRELEAKALAHEAEQKRLAEERAELARQRAEQEEKNRIATAARAAEEARIKAARDAEDAARKEAQRKADEALRIEREAHEKKMAAERAEIKRQQDEIAAEKRRKQEEADAAARAAEQKAAEERAAAEAETARRAHAEFLKTGPSAAEIIDAIAEEFAVTDVAALQWLKSHVWAEIEVTA